MKIISQNIRRDVKSIISELLNISMLNLSISNAFTQISQCLFSISLLDDFDKFFVLIFECLSSYFLFIRLCLLYLVIEKKTMHVKSKQCLTNSDTFSLNTRDFRFNTEKVCVFNHHLTALRNHKT